MKPKPKKINKYPEHKHVYSKTVLPTISKIFGKTVCKCGKAKLKK